MFKTVGISAREVVNDIVEHFPTTESSEIEKPLFVRIKRKVDQYRLDAFWLEINERPLKRTFTDLQKLSLSTDVFEEDDKISRKVFMQHVTTVESSEASSDILRSYTPSSKDIHEPDGSTKRRDGKCVSKNENKQEQLLYKSRENQEKMGKNARFEQIWKKRRGEKYGRDSGGLNEICHVYDIVRVEADEGIPTIKQDRDEISLEDQAILENFLPLLREYIPSAATEIEADIKPCSYGESGDHVYDLYAVKPSPDMVEDDNSNLFPMVKVDEEEYYTDVYEEEYGSDDSNAEENSKNDYPDEESSDSDEGTETENDEYESSNDAEDSDGTIGGGDEGDGISEEKWKWSYR